MKTPPIPVVFEPLYKVKPWGGRALARLFDKQLPPDQPIGESWELVSLPDNESRVAAGPLAGRTLSDLIEMWGKDLLGAAALADGRFPLLIKFLDAHENLSVQVHPKPAPDDPAGWQSGIKHETWYVLDAEPGAEFYIGLKPDIQPQDVADAANTPRMSGLLRRWPVKAGNCFYLPSGTVHALGAGIVVAEIQTPSDVTYRLYDWDRVGVDGQPRELHIEQALRNIRYDVPDQQIVQPRSHTADMFATVTRVVACERFVLDKLRLAEGISKHLPHAEMAIWVVLSGFGKLARERYECSYQAGDVVLIPADCAQIRADIESDCEILEVKVPMARYSAAQPSAAGEPAR
ncbi:MAG: class I mannose-6-phosphate isomerase [Planctomycetes bacterium]|nr:class I mannose-6-phosphate isomerase [Planctomycetota bacterium]